MSKNILLVDDEERIVFLLEDYLKMEGYKVITAYDGREALEKYNFNKSNLDLIILDIMMPEIDGWTVCRKIREDNKDIPILMLTARSEEYDEVYGLELGADDYIKKPIKPAILMARIKAIFRRLELDKSKKSKIILGDLYINKDSHIVRIQDQEIFLTPKEYDILLLLVEERGRVVSREELLNSIWGYDYFGDYRTVDTHVNRLRPKLLSCQDLIVTVRGFGYRVEDR